MSRKPLSNSKYPNINNIYNIIKRNIICRIFLKSTWTMGFLTIIVSLLSSALTIYYTKKIAQDSGAFAKGEISLYLDSPQLLLSSNATNYLFVGAPNFKDGPYGLDMNYNIINNGDKSLKNIYFTLRYPKSGITTKVDSFSSTGIMHNQGDKFSKYSDHSFDYYTFYFPSLPPKSSVGIKDIISLFETTTFQLVDSSYLELGDSDHKIQLMIVSDDNSPLDYNINIKGIQANSKDELIDKVEKYMVFCAVIFREHVSFLYYFKLLFIDTSPKKVALIYPNENLQQKSDYPLLMFLPNVPDIVQLQFLFHKKEGKTIKGPRYLPDILSF